MKHQKLALILLPLLIFSFLSVMQLPYAAAETTYLGNTEAVSDISISIAGKIGGVPFTYSGDTKEVTTISMYLSSWWAGNTTGLLYDLSDNSLVGRSENRLLTGKSGSWEWDNFTFSGTLPQVINGHEYLLCGWSDSSDLAIGCDYDAKTAQQQTIEYSASTEPDPFVNGQSTNQRDAAIYLTLQDIESEPTPTPTPPPTEDTALCLGDSITAGTSEVTYPQYLASLSDLNVTNGGIIAATSTYLRAYWDANYTEPYTYLFTLMGVNDLVGDAEVSTVEDNLQYIWEDALTQGYDAVFAFTLTPCAGYTNWTEGRQTKLLTVNSWIMEASTIDARIIPINVYALLENTTNSGYLNATYDNSDGLHLNQDGADLLAEQAYAALQEYLTPDPTPTPTATATPTPTPTPTEFTSTETWNIIILLFFLTLGIYLTIRPNFPIIHFVFGLFAIAISAWTLTIAPYFGGLLQLAVIIIGIIVMVSGYKEVY